MDRKLDGVFFRVQDKNGKWVDKCFSDLTEEQRTLIMKGRDEEWLKSMCQILAQTIRNIGDQLDLYIEY